MTAGWKNLRDQRPLQGDVELAGHIHWSVMHGAVMLELAGLLKKPLDARTIAQALRMRGARRRTQRHAMKE